MASPPSQAQAQAQAPSGTGKKSGKAKPRRTTFNKSARNAHFSGPGTIEARPSGHCLEGKRKQDVPSQQKYIEISVEQARRSAVAQAQAMGATGNFKSFDSQFGNYLVPVIPTHVVNRSQTPSERGGVVPLSLAQ